MRFFVVPRCGFLWWIDETIVCICHRRQVLVLASSQRVWGSLSPDTSCPVTQMLASSQNGAPASGLLSGGFVQTRMIRVCTKPALTVRIRGLVQGSRRLRCRRRCRSLRQSRFRRHFRSQNRCQSPSRFQTRYHSLPHSPG